MAQRKVMVIGLDSVTLDLIRPWADQGRLPNLGRFLAQGAAGPLRTTIPVMSPAAWSTFATGVNPGKHGIIDFCQIAPDAYSASFMNRTHRRGPTFWEIAAEHGIRGGVINVPITYPPKEYDGFIISGVLSPGVRRQIASPPELFDELLEVSPNYAIDVDVVDTGGGDVRMQFLERALATVEARRDAAVGLYRKHRPPLFCVVFMAADRVSHYFWRYMETAQGGGEVDERLANAIRSVYEKLDDAVGALLAEAGDDTDVLILSDHGAGPLRGGLNLRGVLARAGLLTESRPSVLGRIGKRAIESFARIAPTSLKSRLKARFAGLAQKGASMVAFSGIDFSRTKAYPTGDSAGVFVNLKGRQPGGIVEGGDEYEAVRDQIIAALGELADPQTSEKIAEGVYRREEIWSGPCLDRLPDVIMVQAEQLYATTLLAEAAGDEVFYDLPDPGRGGLQRHGDHRKDGTFLAIGPHIRACETQDAHIADVPATVLAILGCPIPSQFDGRVLTEILTDDVDIPQRTAGPDARVAGKEVLTEEDQAEVERRLRGLGYI